jgi:DNA-binding XRE family transcriptional regulator
MDRETQHRLETAGFRIGDAEDFLELTGEERRVVELRLAVSRAVRSLRERAGLTQEALAAKLKSSQSRVAKIEAGASGVSLDLSFRALFAVGGGLADLTPGRRPKQANNQKRAPKKARSSASRTKLRATEG